MLGLTHAATGKRNLNERKAGRGQARASSQTRAPETFSSRESQTNLPCWHHFRSINLKPGLPKVTRLVYLGGILRNNLPSGLGRLPGLPPRMHTLKKCCPDEEERQFWRPCSFGARKCGYPSMTWTDVCKKYHWQVCVAEAPLPLLQNVLYAFTDPIKKQA